MSKQEFEITEEELQAIYDISRHKMPVMFIGVWTGLDSQEQANRMWQTLGKKYGFVWDSVERCPGKDNHFCLATPMDIMPEYDFKGVKIVEKKSENGCNGCLFKEKYTDWGYGCWNPRLEAKIPACSKGKNGRQFSIIFVKK
jgi:hypothetical protein